MLITIPEILSVKELELCRKELNSVDWSDGRGSAGYLAQAVKSNQQLPDEHPVAQKLGQMILQKLDQNQLFMSAALPLKMVPPLFNRYENSSAYGRHVDGSIRPITGTPYRVRTDLSATLFLSEPDSYEGGELIVEDTFGTRKIKLKAGDLLLYPGTSIHSVEPVKKGVRLASFFWIQSMVREDKQRTLLFELDNAIQKVAMETPEQDALVEFAGVYHNLLRSWGDT